MNTLILFIHTRGGEGSSIQMEARKMKSVMRYKNETVIQPRADTDVRVSRKEI